MDDGGGSPCWASLPPELVRHVADCFLATNDVDYYMGFRAVCRDWRHATDDPTKTWDVRFRPSRWTFFRTDSDNAIYLFINTVTGRFHYKDIPFLNKYRVAAVAEGGFFVLVHKLIAADVYVLNPLTGHLACFILAVSTAFVFGVAAAVFGSPPTLVLFDIENNRLHRADLGGEHTYVRYHKWVHCNLVRHAIHNGVYNLVGRPFFDDPLKVFSSDQMDMVSCGRAFLVKSDGKVLMIVKQEDGMEVFKVQAGRDVWEPVRSIGDDCAIFIGTYKCVSIDASKFPSIHGNCIYHQQEIAYEPWNLMIYKYDMRKQKTEMVIGEAGGTVGIYDGGINITRLVSCCMATSPYLTKRIAHLKH
jgi:hypothetical protein